MASDLLVVFAFLFSFLFVLSGSFGPPFLLVKLIVTAFSVKIHNLFFVLRIFVGILRHYIIVVATRHGI